MIRSVKIATSFSYRHLTHLQVSLLSNLQRCIHTLNKQEGTCHRKYLRNITRHWDDKLNLRPQCQLLVPSKHLHLHPPVYASNISDDRVKSFSNLKSSPVSISTDIFSENRKDIIARLSENDFRKTAPRAVRKADKDATASKSAVFLPFCLVNGEPSVLLTLRSAKLTKHRGLVSFPGGRMDPSDVDGTHTALREMEEELGLPASCADVWGELTPIMDRSNTLIYVILGFIGHLESLKLQENPDEVEAVFTMTLRQLCMPDNRSYTFFDRGYYTYTSPVFLGGDHRIWGLTAMMLDQAMNIILPTEYQSYGTLGVHFTTMKEGVSAA